MKIPESVLSNVVDIINVYTEQPYKKYIFEHTNQDFNIFTSKVIREVLDELKDLVEVTYDTVYPCIKRRQAQKKRWHNKEITGKSGFFNEVEVVAKGLYEQLEKVNEVEKFKLLYNLNNYEELRDARLLEMKEWLETEELPVCHFRYIDTKKPNQIETAMINDIKYILLKEIKEKCPNGKQSAILSLPNSMSNIPIDFNNKVRLSEDSLVTIGREEYFVNKYYIDDTTVLESRLNAEVLKQGVIGRVLKALNSTDVEIFLYCMSLRDENFYTTREILIEIREIVKNVFTSTGEKNYIAVKESLYRMQFLSSGLIDSALRGFTVKILDNVEIIKTTDGKEMAKITVNIDIVNEYIKNQTINMYKDIIDRFELDSSKVAIYPLQRERIRCATNHKGDGSLTLKTNINFFRGILYFSNKKKKENIKAIEKMLTEIISNNITLKSFERKGDTFNLEFYPVSIQERRDLLNNKDPKGLIEDTLYEQMHLDIG